MTETHDWNGEATVTVDGNDYRCDITCEVQDSFYGSFPIRHDYLVTLEQFNAWDYGSHQVIEPKLRRKIKVALTERILEMHDQIIRQTV